MGRLRQKQPRFVLNQEDYDQLKERVLNRDGWKCQCCGTSANLQVHHLVRRSQLGPDALENLMTLCAGCHRREHNQSDRACRVEASAL
jgi:5-methylcytosine-specific restriction endonuclease McrA